jgi:hypothetical protein
MERTTPSFIADVMARVLLQFVVVACQLVTDYVDHIHFPLPQVRALQLKYVFLGKEWRK